MVSTIGKLAIASVVAAGLGGVCLSSSFKNKNPDKQVHEETILFSIKETGEYGNEEDKNKFGGKYSYYFLSSIEGKNESEWDLKVKNLKEKKESLSKNSFFKGIEEKSKLKEKCKKQYESSSFDNSKDEWKEVWIYCSLLEGKPTTISEAIASNRDRKYSSNQSKLGHKLKGSVISTEDYENLRFWYLRDSEFWRNELGTSNFFNKNGVAKTLKTMCAEAYEENNHSSKTNETEVKKYCSLD